MASFDPVQRAADERGRYNLSGDISLEVVTVHVTALGLWDGSYLVAISFLILWKRLPASG